MINKIFSFLLIYSILNVSLKLSLQWFCSYICYKLINNFEKATIEGIRNKITLKIIKILKYFNI